MMMTAPPVGLMEKMKKPYIMAKRYEWGSFREYFRKHRELLDKQIDLHHNTPLHYAAHCGNPEMYREMLGLVDSDNVKRVLRLQDDLGNTPLHEVAFTGEVEMTMSILEHEELPGSEQYQPLLEMRNNSGETPVYRAAALGKTDLLCFFLQQLSVDPTIHFHRTGDMMSILHAAVIDQFFSTALWLLRWREDLAYEKEDNELTTLQLLAKMPSAFKSHTQMGPFKNFLYFLLPDFKDDFPYYRQNMELAIRKEDLESGEGGKNDPPLVKMKPSAFHWLWYTMWRIVAKEWKEIDKLWRKKEMHNLARELVEFLAQKDYSWRNSAIARDRTVSMGRSQHEGIKTEKNDDEHKKERIHKDDKKPSYTPLHMAACNGITEIIESIIHFNPHSIEHVNEDEQNLLHMAVKHRQQEVYRILKKLKMVRSLAGKIDEEGNTVLHCVAEFQGGYHDNAMQLIDDWHWFDRIEKILPYRYTIHKNKDNKTAKELFMEKHALLLKDAREWIKGTAQSFSVIVVLVATVVFAAAYTVPGGNDDDGFPRFLHHPIFLVFTIMDVFALVSSFVSMIMFLSILSSPCKMSDFRRSLPRKLMTGFAFLFFSMATTMMSFSATILINIKLEKSKWTSSLTYCAVFFLFCLFALVQFPLYVRITRCARSCYFKLEKIIPRSLLKLLRKGRRQKLWDIRI